MSIRKIQFLPTLALAGLSFMLACNPVRAEETQEAAPAAASTSTTTATTSDAAPANPNRGGLLPGETREQKRERLLKGIEAQTGPLAPTQRTHILAVLAAAGDEMAAARANTMLTEAQQSEVVSRVHSEIFSRISVALTPAQQAKMKETSGYSGSRGMNASESLEQRRERLLKRYEKISDLTVKQKSDLMALTDASYEEMEKVNDNAALTQDQKRTAVRKVHTDTNAKVEAVLTKSQREQWQKIQAEFRPGRGEKTTVAARN